MVIDLDQSETNNTTSKRSSLQLKPVAGAKPYSVNVYYFLLLYASDYFKIT